MTIRPRITRSIPFWILVAGSLAAAIAGLVMTLTTLGAMSTPLLDGSATGVDVYVGQVWAIFGAVLLGAGIVGVAMALTLATGAWLLRPDMGFPEPSRDADDAPAHERDAPDAADEPDEAHDAEEPPRLS